MKISDILKIILGISLVLLGLLGGLIPVFQGWIFGIPGLIILSKYFSPARKLLKGVKEKIKKTTNDDKRDV